MPAASCHMSTPSAHPPQPCWLRSCHCLQIDLFGEIAGVSFTPLGDALFVSIADVTYSSLLQYERAGAGGLEEVLAAQPP